MPTATISALPRKRSSPSFRRARSASPTSRPRSRRSICSPTPTGPTWPWASISWPRKATARSSAAASASTTSRSSNERLRENNLPRGSLSVVHRPPQVRLLPALRVRPGRRADRGLDVRDQAHPRDHPLPAPALQDLPLKRSPRSPRRPRHLRLRQEPRRQRSHGRSSRPAGFRLIADPAGADVIILNTCGFIGPSRDEADEAIRSALAPRQARGAPQGDRRRLLRRKEPGRALPPAIPPSTPGSGSGISTRSWPSSEGRALPARPADLPLRRRRSAGGLHALAPGPTSRSRKAAPTRALFARFPRSKVRTGRGPSRSIVARGRGASPARGVRELVLISQDTTYYGRDRASRSAAGPAPQEPRPRPRPGLDPDSLRVSRGDRRRAPRGPGRAQGLPLPGYPLPARRSAASSGRMGRSMARGGPSPPRQDPEAVPESPCGPPSSSAFPAKAGGNSGLCKLRPGSPVRSSRRLHVFARRGNGRPRARRSRPGKEERRDAARSWSSRRRSPRARSQDSSADDEGPPRGPIAEGSAARPNANPGARSRRCRPRRRRHARGRRVWPLRRVEITAPDPMTFGAGLSHEHLRQDRCDVLRLRLLSFRPGHLRQPQDRPLFNALVLGLSGPSRPDHRRSLPRRRVRPLADIRRSSAGRTPGPSSSTRSAASGSRSSRAPPTWGFVAAGFVLFRIFDVVKPYPIRSLEALPPGWGIMADDVLAGLYAAAVMQVYIALL